MAPEPEDDGRVHCRLDTLLAERGMTLTRLAEVVGVSVVNLSVLKNDRARAIRFSTLQAICTALSCDVGDLLTVGAPGSGRDVAAGEVAEAQRGEDGRVDQ